MIVPVASIEDVVFDVSNVLRIPVLAAALIVLGAVVVEFGALAVELTRRRRRDHARIEVAARAARAAIAAGDHALAGRHVLGAASSAAMRAVLERVLADVAETPVESNRLSKSLANFDLDSLRRLERTRLLVRAGPALGLMGTLIPLSPALSGLAAGNVNVLSANLRVAFSVTVLGLLVGVLAFGISLVRDRLYAQDLSDVEYIAAELEAGVVRGAGAAA